MTGARTGPLPRLLLAVALAVGGLYVGWIAIRATALELVSGGASSASALIGGEPEFVLGAAMGTFVTNKANVPPTLLPAIRRAAAEMPLDDRPYLLIGSDYLRAGRTALATKVLEAGRRLDPRQRWIHLLLVDRYLRTNDYAAIAAEFSVLARLVGAAQGPIATVLAQMSVAPETRDAVRETLRRDTTLERSVLTSLASSDVEPTVILAMASPAAMAGASAPDGWGTTLVNRLVQKRRYALARAVWQRTNRLTDQQVAPLLYDAELKGLPGQSPFNWDVRSGEVAAVDLRGNMFQITYYGRDPGDLAAQLLVLPPGRYRFSQVVTGSQQAAGSALTWSVECDGQPERKLAQLQLQLPLNSSAPRRAAVDLVVPQGCPAQRLHLIASPGEFPAPASLSIGQLKLQRLGDK